MSEGQNLAIVKKLNLDEDIVSKLTKQQLGWLMLAEDKRKVFTELQNQELIVQGFMNSIESEADLDKCQERLKQAKAALAELKQRRLDFTNMIGEKLTKPAMEFEKRCEPLITAGQSRELKLREAEEAKAEEANKLLREENEFVAHITNEQYRLAANYRDGLQKLISYFYQKALNEKMKPASMKEYKVFVASELRTLGLDKTIKFNRKLLSQERAIELYDSVRKYDPEQDLNKAITSIEEKFSLYANDLKNAEAAIEADKRQAEEESDRLKQSLEIKSATNTLLSQATPQFEGPKVRRKMAIVIENSDEWALLVISTFIANFTDCRRYVKSKTWEKLSIGQMSECLTKLLNDDEQFELPAGFQTQEIKK